MSATLIFVHQFTAGLCKNILFQTRTFKPLLLSAAWCHSQVYVSFGHNVHWNQSRMRPHNMFSREAHCMKTSVLLTRPSGFPGSLPATLSPCYTAFSMIQAPSIITAKVLIMTSNSVGTLANGNTAGCWRKCYHYLYFRLGDKLMRINTIDIKIISYCCYYVEKLLHCRFHSIIWKKQFSLNNTTFVFKIYSKMPFKIAKLIILTA